MPISLGIGTAITRGGGLYGPQPQLDLNFASLLSLTSSVGPTPSFTRASTGTYFDASGVLTTAAINGPRFDHVYNGSSWASKGLLIEEQRTNQLLNSGTLSTQSVTTTAVANTLSFYGTGTITLSGTSSAGPLVGTGASDRVLLTFTPTAGTLTLTVSGTVGNAQLELGSFATSYIPTTSAVVTRSADVCQITGGDFTSFWNASEGSFAVEYDRIFTPSVGVNYFSLVDGGSYANRMGFVYDPSVAIIGDHMFIVVGGVLLGRVGTGTVVSSAGGKFASCYKVNDFAGTSNGAAVSAIASGAVPAITRMAVGGSALDGIYLNGHISRLRYYNTRLTNSQLVALST